MKKKCNFRRLLFVLLLADIICAGFFGWKITEQAIPDTVYLSKKEEKGKLEIVNGRIYQVIARYIEVDEKPYVLELIRCLES